MFSSEKKLFLTARVKWSFLSSLLVSSSRLWLYSSHSINLDSCICVVVHSIFKFSAFLDSVSSFQENRTLPCEFFILISAFARNRNLNTQLPYINVLKSFISVFQNCVPSHNRNSYNRSMRLSRSLLLQWRLYNCPRSTVGSLRAIVCLIGWRIWQTFPILLQL